MNSYQLEWDILLVEDAYDEKSIWIQSSKNSFSAIGEKKSRGENLFEYGNAACISSVSIITKELSGWKNNPHKFR